MEVLRVDKLEVLRVDKLFRKAVFHQVINIHHKSRPQMLIMYLNLIEKASQRIRVYILLGPLRKAFQII